MLLFIGLGKTSKGDTIHCGGCGALLAGVEQICRVMDRPPRKTYLNPDNIPCPLLTLSDATGMKSADDSSTDHTWFKGYAWRPVSCGACDLFLGWRFEAAGGQSPIAFYGLLEERLISRPASAGK